MKMKRKRVEKEIPRKRRKYDNMVDKFVKEEYIKEEQDLVGKRLKHIVNSYVNPRHKDIVNFYSKKMIQSNDIKYYLPYCNVNDEDITYFIYPQCLHNFGFLFFNENLENSSTTLTFKCRLGGNFRKKMKGLTNLSENKNEILIDVRFSKKHFGNVVSNIWDVDKDLDYDRYYLQLYQTLDNVLIYQLTCDKGYLVGMLDPLNWKLDSNHFKNYLQIEEKMIDKLKKMIYYPVD